MRKYSRSVNWQPSNEVKKRLIRLIDQLNINWVKKADIYAYSSTGSSTRAYARIWGLGRIWQLALKEKPAYVIEVISERFDKLSEKQKDEVLLHELTHIPKNFSGALIPHTRRKKGSFHDKLKKIYEDYRSARR